MLCVIPVIGRRVSFGTANGAAPIRAPTEVKWVRANPERNVVLIASDIAWNLSRVIGGTALSLWIQT